jgi:hypothetical protein
MPLDMGYLEDLGYERVCKIIDEQGNKTAAANHLNVSRGTMWRFLKAHDQELVEMVPEVKDLRKLQREGDKSKEELRLLKKKLKSAEKELEQIRELQAAAEVAQQKHRLKKLAPKTKKGKGGSATAIICLTDWHSEENVDPDTIQGLNSHDLSRCAKKINRTWDKALYMLEFARGISNIEEVCLWFGGDLISGMIHEELEEANFLGPTDAVLWVQDHMCNGIDLMLREAGVDHIDVVCNGGNHGRSMKQKRISTWYRHSWEYLAYKNVERIFRNKPVNFNVTTGYHAIHETQGKKIRFHHGDAIRYGGGVGGITIPVRKKLHAWNKSCPVDLDIFGHFHQFLRAWEFVSIGCLVGYNAYANQIGCDFQPPTQGFVVVDRSQPGAVIAEPIFCDV